METLKYFKETLSLFFVFVFVICYNFFEVEYEEKDYYI